MEAKMIHSVQSCTWMNGDKMTRKPAGLIRVPQRSMGKKGINMSLFVQTNTKSLARRKQLSLKVSSSLKNSSGSVLVSGGSPATLDESLALKNKSLQIEPYLNGRSIYLVGMMGSGKTTIGRLLAEVLGYSFFDSDSLVETLGGLSVAEMFEQHGEGFFRDKETEVLQEVSMNHCLVISTGGGAVIRPINWKHMRSGISVWLDVPIDCLARRISAIGTGSRPLLHGETGDAYTTAYKRLSTIFEERHEAYANANARVSLEHITAKLGNIEVDNVTPAVIAIEVLEQIESFLKDDDLAI